MLIFKSYLKLLQVYSFVFFLFKLIFKCKYTNYNTNIHTVTGPGHSIHDNDYERYSAKRTLIFYILLYFITFV